VVADPTVLLHFVVKRAFVFLPFAYFCPLSYFYLSSFLLFSLYDNDINEIAEGAQGTVAGTTKIYDAHIYRTLII
jgi:hypothetical protein